MKTLVVLSLNKNGMGKVEHADMNTLTYLLMKYNRKMVLECWGWGTNKKGEFCMPYDKDFADLGS